MKRSGSSLAALCAPALLLLIANASAQSDGTLDPTFGFGGLTTVFFDLSGGGGTRRDLAADVAIQPNRRIVIVGQADFDGVGDTDFAIARLLPDGALDTSFDVDGKTTVFFDLGGVKQDQAFAVALQSDGKIVVAGRAMTADGTFDPALARLLPGGGLDATFGTGGKTTVNLSSGLFDAANAVAVRGDGTILIAGRKDDRGFVARLLSTGAIDPSFATLGVVDISVGPADFATIEDFAVQSDGKILLVGTRHSGTTREVFHCRLLGTGAPEPGTVCGSVGSAHVGRSIVPLSGARSLVTSTFSPFPADPRVAVLRFASDGNLDLSFPVFAEWQFLAGLDSLAADLKVTTDGKILVFGTAQLLGGEFAMLRLNANGTADPAFDRNPESFGDPGDGRVIIDHYARLPTFNHASAARMALDGRGRAILVGSICLPGPDCGSGADWDFMIQRLNVRNDILVDSFE